MSGDQNVEKSTKILSDVSRQQGFYFHTGQDIYTGIYATNLGQFSEILKDIDARSVEFHTRNKDFENWTRFLGDDALASQLATLRNKSLSGEALRSEIVNTVQRRMHELKSSTIRGAGTRSKKMRPKR